MKGTAVVVGSEHMEIVLQQNWGPRIVVRRDDDNKEEVIWGKDLRLLDKEGKPNPYTLKDPYHVMEYHKWNRKRLRKLKRNSDENVSTYLVEGSFDTFVCE